MLLVDAYNVLHVTGVLPPALAGIEVDGLGLLIARSRRFSSGVRLICDGPAPLGRQPLGALLDPGAARVLRLADHPHIEIVYAGAGRDADSLIEGLIGASPAPRRLTVVSSDRRIRAAARRRRARSLTSEEFLRRLVRDAESRPSPQMADSKPPVPLAPEEISEWLRAFGFDPAASSPPSAEKKPETPPADQPAPSSEKSAPRAEPPEESADPRDPILREAIEEEWRGRLDWDDLDMSRWLDHTDEQDDPDAGPNAGPQRRDDR